MKNKIMNDNEKLDIIVINRQGPINKTAYNAGFATSLHFAQTACGDFVKPENVI